jgi:hypothetical protein
MHLFADDPQFLLDTLHFVADRLHLTTHAYHSVIDPVCGLQTLSGYHPNFVLRQPVQPTKRILDVGSSYQLVEERFLYIREGDCGHSSPCQLTGYSPLNLVCRDCKDGKHFSHHLGDDICQWRNLWYFNISLKTFDEILYPLEEVGEYSMTSTNSRNRLRYFQLVSQSQTKRNRERGSLRGGWQFL